MDNKLFVFKIEVDWGEYIGGIVVEKDTNEKDAFSLLATTDTQLPLSPDKKCDLIFTCNTDKVFGSTFFGGWHE